MTGSSTSFPPRGAAEEGNRPMNYERRNKICKEFFGDCMTELLAKGEEYTKDDEALSNFTEGAEDLGNVTPLQVIYIYMKKHWNSVRNFAKHGKVFSKEGIRGRLMDLAVYAALMVCVMEDEVENRKKEFRFENEDPRLGDNPDAYITHPISGDEPPVTGGGGCV